MFAYQLLEADPLHSVSLIVCFVAPGICVFAEYVLYYFIFMVWCIFRDLRLILGIIDMAVLTYNTTQGDSVYVQGAKRAGL